MKKYTAILIFFIISIMIPISVHAQTAKDAILALKKLEAKIQVGISYRDYLPALGEAKFPVNLYLESIEAKNNTELSILIYKIIDKYDQIGFVFKEKIRGRYRYLDNESVGDAVERRYYNNLLNEYPEMNKFIEEGGAIDRDKSDKGRGIADLKHGRVLNLNYVLPVMIKNNSQDLKRASELYDNLKSRTQNDYDSLKDENEKLRAKITDLQNENDALKAKKKGNR